MSPPFKFSDSASFDSNLSSFFAILDAKDDVLSPALSDAVATLVAGTVDKGNVLSSLYEALRISQAASQAAQKKSSQIAQSSAIAPATLVTRRWFLERVEIEGFRGINNEASPLSLKFKTDAVNSISAPNGVGKSSVYDAICYAISGLIPKLDRLQTTENPGSYYLNRFHLGGVGTVKLALRSDDGVTNVELTVTRDAAGKRTNSATQGIDPDELIAEINREFVLLDGNTFRSFIEVKALDRGRTFAGLLGLARYSSLRQQLQALANTKSFNSHFDVLAHAKLKADADREFRSAREAIAKDYQEIIKESLVPNTTTEIAQQKCRDALASVPILAPICHEKSFMDINVAACISAIKDAEGGTKRDRLSAIIQEQDRWTKADKTSPNDHDITGIAKLAQVREAAVADTSGTLVQELYYAAEKVFLSEDWPSETTCPTCERDDGTSILARVQGKLAAFSAVATATDALASEWQGKGWSDLLGLEGLVHQDAAKQIIRQRVAVAEAGTLNFAQAVELGSYVRELRQLANGQRDALAAERLSLEKELPPSLVTVTTLVEAVRRLQSHWRDLSKYQKRLSEETDRAKTVDRLKGFLDQAASLFAAADSDIASTRLRKVEPMAQALFKDVMYSDVVPALDKREGREELDIRLSEFWGLKNLSAQALLSESYQNAFAVSVYLAAATLYGGGARFVILDDVTSSFDAGHQHHIVEVIRTQFARPANQSGPQVILLSHDTLLEKLFNKHSAASSWSHQRLEGTARTAVLPQSGAVNKVRDTTLDLLNAGRVDDAAPRIRQYLEYTLHEVIDRCRIPVPLDLAFGDDKRTPGEYLKAIEAAVALHAKANSLVLDPSQVQAITLHSTSIVSNYLSHWSTGQAQSFSAPALLGVMRAIDAFPDCFKYEPTPGAQRRFYKSLSNK